MNEYIEKAIADRKRYFLTIAIIMGIFACVTTLLFDHHSRAFESGPDDLVLLRGSISSRIVAGVVVGVLWCMLAFYAEAFLLARFFGKVIANANKLGIGKDITDIGENDGSGKSGITDITE